MSLSCVGSDHGPNFALLRQIRNRAPRNNLYAAGGVRHATDLQRLTDMGIDGVLLSSALHQRRVDPSTLTSGRFE